MRLFKKHTKAIFGGLGLVIFSALIVLIMMAPSGAVMNEQQATAAATSQPVSYIPNPTMNTNVTWSTFNSSWGELEYNNGTGMNNLSAQTNPAYVNPISVKTSDIKPMTLNGSYAGINFFNASEYTGYYGNPDSGAHNGKNAIYFNGNATSTSYLFDSFFTKIPWAQMPSQNPSFDYITATLSLSASSGSTASAGLSIGNTTSTGAYSARKIYDPLTAGKSMYISESISQLIAGSGLQVNESASPYIMIGTYITQAEAPSADTPMVNLTMTNLAITTYPIILGQNSTGAQITQAVNEAHLTSFKPSTQMTIQNNGYSVAVSQNLQNTTESQSATSSGKYIEQATYQGTFSLPSAPDLTYSNSVIQMNLTTPGSQYEVANLNGISYLTTLQTKNNGTFVFTTVNPNQQNSLILEVEFTAAQWNASTSAPSFFSIAGIEYYWWVGVIGLLSIVGLGAAASSHFNGEEENLKVPKGKFGR